MSSEGTQPLGRARPQETPAVAAPLLRRGMGNLATVAAHLVLMTWTVFVAFPFLWMVVTSFKTDQEIFFSPWRLPSALRWENFARAWTDASIGRYFLNSLIVVTGAMVLTLLCASMTAYALARFDFPGNRILYYCFLAGLMFPVFLALVPLFFVVRDLHLVGTFQGLIIVYTAYSLPFSIFFLHGFFRSLPGEVAEAAIVDGASPYRVFFDVMLPMAQPGLVAVGIFNFLGQWNQFILPLILMPNPDRYVLSQGLAFLAIQRGYESDWSALFAGLTITMLPTLIVYVFFQRRVQQGLTVGALKG